MKRLLSFFAFCLVAGCPLSAQAQLTLYLNKVAPKLTVWALVNDSTNAYLGTGTYEWASNPAPANALTPTTPTLLPPTELQRLHQRVAEATHLPESTVAQAKHEQMEIRRNSAPARPNTAKLNPSK